MHAPVKFRVNKIKRTEIVIPARSHFQFTVAERRIVQIFRFARCALGSAPSERISDRTGILRHPAAAELIGQVGYVVDIELRLDEEIALHINLESDAAVHLKVIGVDARWRTG